ncbi:MAG: hypothetical protein EOM50_04285 [Erysipelotrichia bacterium]|nr:hypothetical protein [Erysipelotrichia bacterium]
MGKTANFLFFKRHRSYIVNLRYLRNVDKKGLLLNNGIKIPISRNSQKKVLEKYFEYIRNTN